MEDVGRHNAIDKIAGYMHLNRISPAGKIFYTTGRLTSEMVIKTVQMGIPILISRSGFTAWGVQLAAKANLTLIGRARGKRFVALAGASMLEGLVLVSAIRDRMAHGASKPDAIEQARLARLRPVLMTGSVAALGFVPMMLSTGIGAEVQRPLATVVVGGMLLGPIMLLVVVPALQMLFLTDDGTGPATTATPDFRET